MEEIVYFIQAGNDGPIKIGKAKDLKRRLQAIQTDCPYPIQILAIDSTNHEKEWHIKYKKYCLHGEWFSPHSALLKEIEKIKEANNPKKGTIRCNWCHIAMNGTTGRCPKCNRRNCHITWYHKPSRKTFRIFGGGFTFASAKNVLLLMNKEYLDHQDPHSPVRFNIEKWVSYSRDNGMQKFTNKNKG